MVLVNTKVVKDTATPALARLRRSLSASQIKRAIGTAVVKLVREHVLQNPPNKRGFPSTGFWKSTAKGVYWDETDDGLVVGVDNEKAPGAVKLLYYGGDVRMKDKMLTIPAAAPFYGHKATEFTNLRFAMFRGVRGTLKALVVGKGGVGSVDFSTGRERSVKGAGVRSQGMVAYWLKEEVSVGAHPEFIPDRETMAQAAIAAVRQLVEGRAA